MDLREIITLSQKPQSAFCISYVDNGTLRYFLCAWRFVWACRCASHLRRWRGSRRKKHSVLQPFHHDFGPSDVIMVDAINTSNAAVSVLSCSAEPVEQMPSEEKDEGVRSKAVGRSIAAEGAASSAAASTAATTGASKRVESAHECLLSF